MKTDEFDHLDLSTMLGNADNWTNYLLVYKYYRIKAVNITCYASSISAVGLAGTSAAESTYVRQPLVVAYSPSSTVTASLNMDKMLRNPSAAFVATDRDTKITFTPIITKSDDFNGYFLVESTDNRFGFFQFYQHALKIGGTVQSSIEPLLYFIFDFTIEFKQYKI